MHQAESVVLIHKYLEQNQHRQWCAQVWCAQEGLNAFGDCHLFFVGHHWFCYNVAMAEP